MLLVFFYLSVTVVISNEITTTSNEWYTEGEWTYTNQAWQIVASSVDSWLILHRANFVNVNGDASYEITWEYAINFRNMPEKYIGLELYNGLARTGCVSYYIGFGLWTDFKYYLEIGRYDNIDSTATYTVLDEVEILYNNFARQQMTVSITGGNLIVVKIDGTQMISHYDSDVVVADLLGQGSNTGYIGFSTSPGIDLTVYSLTVTGGVVKQIVQYLNTESCDATIGTTTTHDPTSQPSTVPTSVPTPSPVFTQKYVYIRSDGCDYGYCSTALAQSCVSPVNGASCASVDYGWQCFNGIGGISTSCSSTGYDGNGFFDIGDGHDWYFPFVINATNKNIIVRGQSALSTTLHITGASSVFATCAASQLCWLGFSSLTISTTFVSTTNNDVATQMLMTEGGTLDIIDVIFDGTDSAVLLTQWLISNQRSYVRVENARFVNNSASYQFMSATVEFVNCIFEHNLIVAMSGGQHGFIHAADGATLQFINCTFIDNEQDGRAMFTINSSSSVTLEHSVFVGNRMSLDNRHPMLHVSDAHLRVFDTAFFGNSGYDSLIQIDDGSVVLLEGIEVRDNAVQQDIRAFGFETHLIVRNSSFVNGTSDHLYSVYAESAVNVIEGCLWQGYEVTNALFAMRLQTGIFMTVVDSWFTQNVGRIFDQMAGLRIVDSLFSQNIFPATHELGHNAFTQFESCQFMDNTLQQSLFSLTGGKLSLTTTDFLRNSAAHHALIEVLPEQSLESIVVVRSQLSLDQCTFANNTLQQSTPLITATNNSEIEMSITSVDFVGGCDAYQYCIECLDTDLYIDQASTTHNRTLLFGHSSNVDSSNVATTTLHLLEFSDPHQLHNKITFTRFGEHNGSVLFEPCADYNARNFPLHTLLFVARTYSMTPNYNYISPGSIFQTTMSLCNNTFVDCFVSCYAALSCVQNEFVFDNLPSTAVQCVGVLSCWSNRVSVSSVQQVSILCDGDESCKQSTITLRNVSNAVIECVNMTACNGVEITIIDSPNTTVLCYQAGACDDIRIVSNSAENEFYFYNYNQDVHLDIPSKYHADNIHCNDNAYLVFNYTAYELLQNTPNANATQSYAQQVFSSQLPCDGIEFDSADSDTASCTLQYAFTLLPRYEFVEPFMQCIKFPIHELNNISCIGTLPPTSDPTMSPTIEPTVVPTTMPTREPPPHNAFDYFVPVTFVLQEMAQSDIQSIEDDAYFVASDIERIIEMQYAEAAQIIVADFWIRILQIDDKVVEEEKRLSLGSESSVRLISNVTCSEFICNKIINMNTEEEFASQLSEFENSTTLRVQRYFDRQSRVSDVSDSRSNSSKVQFLIEESSSEAKLINPVPVKTPNYMLWFLFGLAGLLALIALLAFLFNKGAICTGLIPGSRPVDDARWWVPLVFALSIWDFYSDINVTIYIWTNENSTQDLILFIAAVGSASFTIVPYVSNLLFASTIKTVIRYNEAAKSWFQTRSIIFTVLVAMGGGCYSALGLISCNIFGLSVFSCGLTRHELKQLRRIKVFGTIVLENVPQLACQLIYAYRINAFSNILAMSFGASLLSVISTTISYIIDRDEHNVRVVQYYIAVQKNASHPPLFPVGSTVPEVTPPPVTPPPMSPRSVLSADTGFTGLSLGSSALRTQPKKRALPLGGPEMVCSVSSRSASSRNKLTQDEASSLRYNKGKTKHLADQIAAIYKTQPKYIEVGDTLLTSSGARTHIIHYVSRRDLVALKKHMRRLGHDVIVSAEYMTSNLFSLGKEEMANLFRTHFELSEQFEVEYNDFSGIRHHKKLILRTEQSVRSLNKHNVKQAIVLSDIDSAMEIPESFHGPVGEIQMEQVPGIMPNHVDAAIEENGDWEYYYEEEN